MKIKQPTLKIKRRCGFTLLEVMVAMVVLSFIFLILFSSLFSANKYWQTAETISEKNDELRLVSRFIRKSISQSIPLIWVDKKKRTLLFKGEQDKLAFTSRLPAHRGGGGLYLITLHVLEKDDMNQLAIHYKLIQPDEYPMDNISDETKHTTLIKNIDSISFSYFGKEDNNLQAQWHNEWPNKEQLPRLIKIELVSESSAKKWPDITIPFQNIHSTNLPEFSITSS